MTQAMIVPITRRRIRVKGRVGIILSITVIFLALIAAVLGKWIAPFDPDAVDLAAILAAPGTDGHLLGTDSIGRDILSRLIAGARISIAAPAMVIVVSTVLGIALGLWCGWAGGVVDAIGSRVIDFLFAFPSLLIAMISVAIFGPGLLAPILGLTLAYIPYTARLVRNLVLQEKYRPYIEAYQIQGFGSFVIASTKLAPNISPTVLAQSALGFGYAVIDLAALSYLGFGVQPPTADWGVMVAQGQDALISGIIWPVLIPGLAIILVVVAVNSLGDALSLRLTGGAQS